MPQINNVLSNSKSTILPTTDGTLLTGDVPGDYAQFQIYIEFFSDAAATVPVTPTAGTATFAGAPNSSHWLAANNPTITATTVIANGLATYTPPTITGMVTKARVTFAGITGAPYAKVTLWGR